LGGSIQMNIIETALKGVFVSENTVFEDERGAFSRLYCAHELQSVLGKRYVVQINHSFTRQIGAIRGLHYQNQPHAEMKIVRCLRGRVFDVAVDLRKDSQTFAQWVSVELTPEKCNTLVIPEGCAHGFQVLEQDSELLYLHTSYYTPTSEGAVHFEDPRIGIKWPLLPTDISYRDLNHPFLSDNFLGLSL
jgi:dTDP-4-dehydrorhamnose 3,5-epimerase